MKKQYSKPAMRAVAMQQRQMLCQSPKVTTTIKTYDAQEDVITNQEDIW